MQKISSFRWSIPAGIGIAFTCISLYMTGVETTEGIAKFLLWPGASAASLLGFGAHDWQGLALYTAGNMVFYCVLFTLIWYVALTARHGTQGNGDDSHSSK
jgi:hypothetical protein